MANLSAKQIATWASHALALIAAALWLGGMIALGAIVAPVVFTIVPAPTSADAMTIVFRRFDAVAITCAAVLLACEMWRVRITPKITRVDFARGASAAIAGALALFEGLVVSPKVEELHRAGAIRGLGELGQRLETAHVLAERTSKCEATFVVVFLVLYVLTTAPARDS